MTIRDGFFIMDAEQEEEAKACSIVHWKEGAPPHDGFYLVTAVDSDKNRFVTMLFRDGYYWVTPDKRRVDERRIIAWCSSYDIKPCSIELSGDTI